MGFEFEQGLDTKMVLAKSHKTESGKLAWNTDSAQLMTFGDISISPAAVVLNYGQGLFEGMRVYRRPHNGQLFLFRPEKNWVRLCLGCERLCMPSPSYEDFLNLLYSVVNANRSVIGTDGSGFYLRPLIFGNGARLGLGPAPEYTFLIWGQSVGEYMASSDNTLWIERTAFRATEGGVGNIKFIGNYAPTFQLQLDVRDKGYCDVLYLSSKDESSVEEMCAANVFFVFDHEVVTPDSKNILDGVTRDSIIELATAMPDLISGRSIRKGVITIEDVRKASFAFCCGTATVMSAISAVEGRGIDRIEYKEPFNFKELRKALEKQTTDEGVMGWSHKVPEGSALVCQ